MPAVRAIVRDAGKRRTDRMSAFVLGVVKSPAFQMSRVEPAETTDARDVGHRADQGPGKEQNAMFITQKHISRRTVLRGMGVTVALPFLEAMVPAAHRAGEDRGGQDAPGGHRDGARLGRRHRDRPAEEPVVAGGGRARLRPVARAA